ncbi:MAG: arginine--tRNA ligase [Candidatus Micrarchaeia archaeon]
MDEFPYEKIIESISKNISDALVNLDIEGNEKDIRNSIVPSKLYGDISSSICFSLSKKNSIKIEDIANKLKGEIKLPYLIDKVTIEGGFLNFHISKGSFAKESISFLIKNRNNVFPLNLIEGKTAMVEYPSVNPNKPWHIGHLRNALLGNAVSNIIEACGGKVLRTDYIDDLGLQIAESVWWHIKSKANFEQTVKFDHWLGEEYVKANNYIEEHKEVAEKEINTLLSLMEQDGTYESKIAHDIANECVKAQYKTAYDYGIYHDLMVWESDIVRDNLLGKSLDMLIHNGFAKKVESGNYKDCIVIDLSSIKNLPKEFKGLQESTKVLIRSNGVPTYLAKDIAFHMWKFGIIEDSLKYTLFVEKQPNGKPLYSTGYNGTQRKFGPIDLCINIIDARQSYPQTLLRLAFESINKNTIAENIKHLAYGSVEIESGTLSGRKGTWIGYSADELLEEAKNKALKSIKDKFEFSKEEQERIAKSVGLAAIKFEFLKLNPDKEIIFSWGRALNFEGNSGPYLQYTYARASRIIEDAGNLEYNYEHLVLLESSYEFELIKALSRVYPVFKKALNEYKPNIVVEYAIELADLFSKFYEHCPVLKADPDLRSARLMLLDSFMVIMAGVLKIIGIDVLNKM